MVAKSGKLHGDNSEEAARGQTVTHPKVAWDTSDNQPVYANAANVIAERDAIALLFGRIHSSQEGENETKIQISDRIALSLIAAEQFCVLLDKAIQDYERDFGELHTQGVQKR